MSVYEPVFRRHVKVKPYEEFMRRDSGLVACFLPAVQLRRSTLALVLVLPLLVLRYRRLARKRLRPTLLRDDMDVQLRRTRCIRPMEVPLTGSTHSPTDPRVPEKVGQNKKCSAPAQLASTLYYFL